MFGFGGGGDGKEGGVAQRWNADKGSGLIKPDAGGEDILCPASSIEDGNALKEGDPVKYKRGKDDQGKDCAQQVTGGITLAPRKAMFGFGGGAKPEGKDEAIAPPPKAKDEVVAAAKSPKVAEGIAPVAMVAAVAAPVAAAGAFSMFGFGGGAKPEAKEGGTALSWNPKEGSGFIEPFDGGAKILCPASSIEDGNALKKGDPVTYRRGKDDQGKDVAEQVTGG